MTWWAAYCEPKRELLARDSLIALGLDVFCPFESVTRRVRVRSWANAFRVRVCEEPVFPRYLFVDGASVSVVRGARGVSDVVNNCGVPLELPCAVVERLRCAADARGMVSSKDISKLSFALGWKEGDAFAFKEGSRLSGLMGQIASLAKLDETGEIKAWVTLFGRAICVALDRHEVGAVASRVGAVAAVPRIATSVVGLAPAY
jgi:transcription antitermination factor NusG